MTEEMTLAEIVKAPELPPDAPVQARIIRVMRELKGIAKGGYNQQQGFKYRGIEQLTVVLHDLCAEHGIFPLPQVLETEWSMSETKNHTPMETVRMRCQWEIMGLAGDSVTAITAGEGSDMSDKATNKAATSAYKYMLLQVFMIGDPADDADAVTNEHGSTPAQSSGSTGRGSGTRAAPTSGRPLPTAGAPGQAAKPAPAQHAAAPAAAPEPAPASTLPTAASERPSGDPVTPQTLRDITAALGQVGLDAQDAILRYVAAVIGRKINRSTEMTEMEGLTLLEALLSDIEKAGTENG
jgi:hypothetical protein